jgi:hypothetical protein
MPFPLDLSDDVLLAIGAVSAQWATLEYYLSRTTLICLEKFKNKPPKLSKNQPFNERRDAFVDALMWSNVPAHVQQWGIDLGNRIEAVEDKRHKIIHGMANEVSDNREDDDAPPPNSLTVSIVRDHPKHFFMERLTVNEIGDIATEIANINEDMVRLYLFLWGVPLTRT